MLLILALSACNQVYGLDPTNIREIGVDAPPDLEDEDLDGVPNEFDNCPGIPNNAQTNSDGDEVGDACDRIPTQGTETIAARIMFNRPALDEREWRGSGWEFREGYVIQPTPGGSASMFMERAYEGVALFVEVRMTPISIDRANVANRVALVLEGLGGNECYVHVTAQDNGLFVASGAGAAGNGQPPVDDNVPFVLRATSGRTAAPPDNAPYIACSIGSVAQKITTALPLPGPIGLTTRAAAARIDYIVIYASASP